MPNRKFAYTGVLVTLSLWAGLAHAEISPEGAWAHIVSRAQALDYSVSAITSTEADQLTVSDIVFRTDDFDVGFSLKFEAGDWQFIPQSDGSVRLNMAEDARWYLKFKDMDDERFEINVAQTNKDSFVVFRHEDDQIRSEYEWGSLRLDLLKINDDVKEIGKDQLQLSVTLDDISGSTAVRQSNISASNGSTNILAASIDLNLAPDGEDFRASWQASLNDLVLSSMFQTHDGVSLQDFEKAIRFGMISAMSYSHGRGQTEFRYFGEDGDVVISSSSVGGSISADLSKLGINFLSQMSGWDVSVMGSLVPIPFDASLGALAYGISLPMIASEEEQRLGLRFELEDVSLSDNVWDMFDPLNVFNRDKVSVKFDVSGLMRLLTDYTSFDVENADDIGALRAAAEMRSVKIKSLMLSAFGASAQVEGEFSFDSSDYYTFDGIPRPEGSLRLKMKGVNSLLDKLSNSGLIGADEVMGARMVMGMFTVPVGRDEVEAELWIDENGGVYANGQKIQ